MKQIQAVLSVATVLVMSGCLSMHVAHSGTIAYQNGATYEGQILEGVPDGKGTMTFADGATYEGAFKKGLMDGKGVYNYADGVSRYEGDFRKGKRHGKGVLTRPFVRPHLNIDTVVEHTGTFVNDKPYGIAVQEVVGVFTIVCEVKEDGLAYGLGVRTYANGDKYVGEFSWNHPYDGTYTWANGDKYTGPFDGNSPNGKGVKTFADGGKYEGDFEAGVMQGTGVYTFPDGSRYEGDFKGGKMEGRGVFVAEDGTRIEARFADDKLIKVLEK